MLPILGGTRHFCYPSHCNSTGHPSSQSPSTSTFTWEEEQGIRCSSKMGCAEYLCYPQSCNTTWCLSGQTPAPSHWRKGRRSGALLYLEVLGIFVILHLITALVIQGAHNRKNRCSSITECTGHLCYPLSCDTIARAAMHHMGGRGGSKMLLYTWRCWIFPLPPLSDQAEFVYTWPLYYMSLLDV